MGPAGLADAGMGPIAIYWQQSLEMRMKCVLGASGGEEEGSVHFWTYRCGEDIQERRQVGTWVEMKQEGSR